MQSATLLMHEYNLQNLCKYDVCVRLKIPFSFAKEILRSSNRKYSEISDVSKARRFMNLR